MNTTTIVNQFCDCFSNNLSYLTHYFSSFITVPAPVTTFFSAIGYTVPATKPVSSSPPSNKLAVYTEPASKMNAVFLNEPVGSYVVDAATSYSAVNELGLGLAFTLLTKLPCVGVV